MSGLLRRIKRSRDADAGEPPPGGEAVAPDAALTQAEPAAGRATPVAEPVPAGLDPVEATIRPPAGRRGRLRRRLRYLRRARELMLRDLGGLLYEVHRTGGGQVEPHATVIGAKVERLTAVDAEAHAIEQALGAPRAASVVFQPGVGGTCAVCGELFGSAARFCSNCGAAVGAPPAAAAIPARPAASLLAPGAGGRKPSRWRRAKPVDAAGEAAPGAESAAGAGSPGEPAAEPAPQPTGETTPEPATGEAADAPASEEPTKPFASPANGREDRTPPGLSPGDPLFTRERS